MRTVQAQGVAVVSHPAASAAFFYVPSCRHRMRAPEHAAGRQSCFQPSLLSSCSCMLQKYDRGLVGGTDFDAQALGTAGAGTVAEQRPAV